MTIRKIVLISLPSNKMISIARSKAKIRKISWEARMVLEIVIISHQANLIRVVNIK
jgi:hypothetical protein